MTADNHHADLPPDTPIDASPVKRLALIAAAAGFGGFAALGAVNLGMTPDTGKRDFVLAYLVGFVFWASLPFGALALMALSYLTSATWGVILRRCFQAATRTMPVLALLFLPIAAAVVISGGATTSAGNVSPFWWADGSWGADDHGHTDGDHPQAGDALKGTAREGLRPEAVEEALHKIHDYLNPWFFVIRAVGYFVVLGTIAYFLNLWGRRFEDHDDETAHYNLRGLAGPALLTWALMMTFAATDWVMSVEPTWASSMFPVVFGMNQFICTFAVGILSVYALTAADGRIDGLLKDKFKIDLGSLLFGFTMVWAYATFCQYMLVWAGNLPEELTYFKKRGNEGWQYLAFFLMAFHWLLPFVIFLFREVKTDRRVMQGLCVLLLIVAAADVVWWIVPCYPHEDGGLYVPMAFAAVLGVGGVWGLAYARELGRRAILPRNREGRFLAEYGHHH